MRELEKQLLALGMEPDTVRGLKRWDRVHMISVMANLAVTSNTQDADRYEFMCTPTVEQACAYTSTVVDAIVNVRLHERCRAVSLQCSAGILAVLLSTLHTSLHCKHQ
jgi:hypothetical protein